MRLHLIALVAITLLAGCSDRKTATRVLTNNGYTDIRIEGYRLFACSEDDTFSTGFTASSPAGMTVRGVVCSGLFKGATIRLF